MTLCAHWFKQMQKICDVKLKTIYALFDWLWKIHHKHFNWNDNYLLAFTLLLCIGWWSAVLDERKKHFFFPFSTCDFSIQHTNSKWTIFFLFSLLCGFVRVCVCTILHHQVIIVKSRCLTKRNHTHAHDVYVFVCMHAKHSMFWCDFERNVVSDGAAHTFD